MTDDGPSNGAPFPASAQVHHALDVTVSATERLGQLLQLFPPEVVQVSPVELGYLVVCGS